MIGRGLVVIRRADRLEYHEVSPWELAMAGKNPTPESAAIILEAATEWPPDGYLTEDELAKVRAAHTTLEGHPDYHPLASDIVVVLDAP